MNYSQKVARVFEIVDYILLIPAAFGVLMATLMMSESLAFTLIIWTITALGIVLLVGYFKHSRGRLSERKISLLWFGTIFYNSIPLLFTLYFLYIYLTDNGPDSLYRDNGLLVIFGMFGVWWAIAVFAPAKALYSNYRETQKYL